MSKSAYSRGKEAGHNKGQQDRTSGRSYDSGRMPGASDLFETDYDRGVKDGYKDGWDHADSQDKSSGGCFVTTACIHARRLGDNCEELRILRAFRDSYMCSQERGPELVAEYYSVAPTIVARIDRRPDAKEIYNNLYTHVIAPCVDLIQRGQHEEAFCRYQEMVIELKKAHLST